jgi:hypothetical protein
MQDNVFGVPLKLRTHAELVAAAENEEMIYAVSRCADMRLSTLPPSVQPRISITTCSECREPCWIDLKTAPTNMKIVCLRCAPPPEELNVHADRDVVQEIARHELRRRFGLH